MRENRGSARFGSAGRAGIQGVLKSDVELKNLSITGCCLKSTENIDTVKTGEIYEILIKPEKTSKKHNFKLTAECKWIRKTGDYSEIGFTVTSSPTGKHFQNYVDYIAYRSTVSKPI